MKVKKKRKDPYTISPYIWKLVGQFTTVTIQLSVTALKNTCDSRYLIVMKHGGVGIGDTENKSVRQGLEPRHPHTNPVE